MVEHPARTINRQLRAIDHDHRGLPRSIESARVILC